MTDDVVAAVNAPPERRRSERGLVPLATRATITLLAGAWGAFITYFSLIVAPNHLAKDFSWPWRGARALLEGHNPYHVVRATGPYPFNVGLFYPLPAVITAVPFAPLPPAVAGALFFGISSALLGFGLARTRSDLSKLPLFLSAPFCMAAVLAQWAPLMTAAALLPALQFLTVAKPNVGLACWTYRPTWRGAITAGVFVALTLLIVPTWPVDWREALQAAPRYKGPLFRGASEHYYCRHRDEHTECERAGPLLGPQKDHAAKNSQHQSENQNIHKATTSNVVREVGTSFSFNQKLIFLAQFLDRFGRDTGNQFTLFCQCCGNH